MKKIIILGSTGSIGKSLLKLIGKDKNSFKIKLLSANKNYSLLLKQAKLFNVKNVILTDLETFKLKKNIFIKNKINVFKDYSNLRKILIKKVDYVMNSIVGLDGLEPTLKLIKYSKNIAIANKESIICAWNLINNELKLNKTNFIPVDSEHFSIWYALNRNLKSDNVKKIYLTASGGPLLKFSNKRMKKIRTKDVLKHPNWKMGKKISVDSATLMNKVFEVIEAKKIFNIDYKKLDILIHPDSYIHSIIEFNNKMISIIAHRTTMDIPIFNTLYDDKKKFNDSYNNEIDIKKLNSLSLRKVDKIKFPVVNILDKLPYKNSLFETALVASNDYLVQLYLKNKIEYRFISLYLLKLINLKEIKSLKNKTPKNINEILKINSYVRSKINQIYFN